MSLGCTCGSIHPHNEYIEKDAESKASNFNDVFIKYILPLIQLAHVWIVIDAAELNTTKALTSVGVSPEHIHSISWCMYDFVDMVAQALGNKCACASAPEYYKSEPLNGLHAVVCHDGMQVGHNTIDHLKPLFTRGATRLSIFANIVVKDNKKSARTFHLRLIAIAKQHGYKMVNLCPEVGDYRQTPRSMLMRMFFFDFIKI